MPAVSCADGENLRGWIVGEKCVKAGKIGDCYLKWAYPAVIWTESETLTGSNSSVKALMKLLLTRHLGKKSKLKDGFPKTKSWWLR